VTQGVGGLTAHEVATALDPGEIMAYSLLHAGLIRAAALRLQDETRVVGAGREGLEITSNSGSLVNA
jgi:hypothetical protein